MPPKGEKETAERGFRVIDRREERGDDGRVAPQPSRKTEGSTEGATARAGVPLDFAHFLLSLATEASLHLGLIPNPRTGGRDQNLLLARQTIDILGLLEEKSRGNRTQEEDALLTQLLGELRMHYLQVSKKS